MITVSAAVEGVTDLVVARRLIEYVGADHGALHEAGGKPALRTKLRGYCASAKFRPWFVLVDLDHSHSCAAELVAEWIPVRPSKLCFRVAVRSVEAWLLSDLDGIARFLRVPKVLVPKNPESVSDPKRAIVDLAAKSSSRDVRDGLVPRPRSGRAVGQLYTSTISSFVRDHWSIAKAAGVSPSLARAISCLQALAQGSV